MKWTQIKRRFLLNTCMVFAAVLFASGHLVAQRVKSSLTGVVVDSSGAIVSGAQVTLTNEGTAISSHYVTGPDGAYTFPFLDLGTYTLQTSAPGFKTLIRSGIIVRVDTDERVDLTLEVGAISQEVRVAGKSPLLETVSSTVGQTIDSKYLRDIPLNGRNVFNLLNIIPGSTLGSGYLSTATNPEIDGQDGRGNSYTLDGVSINQEYTGFTSGSGQSYTPPLDSIAEFKVVTNSFDAEYGRALSTVVSLSMRSGTNSFHGTAYDFLRNDLINARTYYASPTAHKPELRYNQFGGAVGGPVLKDKLFFFVASEWLRNIGQAITLSTVPTTAMDNGDFSAFKTQIYDPATTRTGPSGQIIRDPFPGNIIPMNRIDPLATAILAYWPQPNLTTASPNFRIVSGSSTSSVNVATKIDYKLGNSDSLSGRYSYSNTTVEVPSTLPGPGDPNPTANQHTIAPGFQVNEVHTFSPQIVNEARLGFQDNNYKVTGDPDSVADWRTKLGLPSIFGNPDYQLGFPNVAPSGVSQLGTPYDYFLWDSQVWQVNDTLSWSKGEHFIKVGGSFSHIYAQNRVPNYPSGGYAFTGGFTNLPGTNGTGIGYADFLLSDASQAYASFLFPNGLKVIHNEVAGFIQDDYRVTPNLTLNLGLRYDVATVIHNNDGTLFTYDPSTNSTVRANSPVPIDWHDVGPRIGFVDQILPNTVLRGGYGIVYLAQFKGLGGGFVVPPVLQQHQFIATNAFTPALTLEQNFGEYQTSGLTGIPVTPALTVGMFLSNYSGSPYLQNWNLTLQRQFGNAFVVTAGYIGNKGTRLGIDVTDLNQLSVGELGPDSEFGGVPAQKRRPYPGAGAVQGYRNDLWDNYNALQMKLEWRSWHGLSALTSYTHGKGLGIQNYAYIDQTYNKKASYGLNDADLSNVFVQTFAYELPFGKGRQWVNKDGFENQLFGGWNLNGIFTDRGGFPFNPTSAIDQTGSFDGNRSGPRPNRLCNGALPKGQRSNHLWFNTSCFAVPAPYTFGNSSVFPLRGPAAFNLDLSVFKLFTIKEAAQLEFRAEAFGITNTPQFGLPAASIGAATAGQITSATGSRTMQFALKLLF